MPQPPTSPDQEPWTEHDTKAVQEAPNESLKDYPDSYSLYIPSHLAFHDPYNTLFYSRYIVICGTLPTLFEAKTVLAAETESNFVDWQVMEALPQLMFKADAVIHIIGTPTKLMMGEGVPWQYETQ